MKKFALVSIVLLGITGCSNVHLGGKENPISWKQVGELPAQKGFEKNYGVAGPLVGVLNNKYIVVGGGANFPYESVLNGGKKETYSDIYLLEKQGENLNVISQTNWTNKIGYGASITTEEGVYYIGGGITPEADNDILFVTLNNKALKIEKIGDLPFTFQSGGAVKYQDKLYIFAGKQNNKGTNKMWSYDLNTKEVVELANVPGSFVRTQPVYQLLGNEIYVFSGGSNRAYTDGYKYSIEDNSWSEVASVEVDGEQISLIGANSVKLNEHEMLVIGGFNKDLWNSANYYLGSLKGKKLQAYKEEYFGADPHEFGWNEDILVYNTKEDKWTSIGEVPFDAPCGEGLVKISNKIYSINGEIKPGVRTNAIFEGNF